MSLTMFFDGGHVTTNIPFCDKAHMAIARIKADKIIIEKLFASGQELDYINKRFINLPSARSHCSWHGEMAQFIVNNLL